MEYKLTEKQLHKQICDYIKAQYKNVLFNTDLSGIRLTMGQAVQAKKLRSGNGFPDIMILQPKKAYVIESINYYIYCGLFLEVKKETPFKKDGKLKKDKHLEEQYEMHIKMIKLGYWAEFVWTFEGAKRIIDDYLKN